MEQGSQEWLSARAGKITASRMSDVISCMAPKSALCLIEHGGIAKVLGNGAQAIKEAARLTAEGKRVEQAVYEYPRSESFERYAYEIATEILIEGPLATVKTKAMEKGTEREQMARAAYEIETGNIVQEVGFIEYKRDRMVGASPDGLVLDDGGVEIKCPEPLKHTLTLLYGMPKEHVAQVQAGMMVTGRSWWDFISFCPEHKQFPLYIERVQRDDFLIAQMVVRCRELSERAREHVLSIMARNSQ